MESTRLLVASVALISSLLVFLNLRGALQLDFSNTTVELSAPDTISSSSFEKKKKNVPTKRIVFPTLNGTSVASQRRHRDLAVIHVGKTGGETVRHTLRITCRMRQNPVQRKACQASFANTANTTESALSKHVIGTMHCDLIQPLDSLDRATTWVWILWNPLERVVSWFRYMKPANCRPHEDYRSTACNTNRSIVHHRARWTAKFFSPCFSTINQFANALAVADGRDSLMLSSPSPSQSSLPLSLSSNCSQIAWRTIMGEASASSGHVYFNHRYYWKKTIAKWPQKEIWVVRTENLWQDMMGLEQLLLEDDLSKDQVSNIAATAATAATAAGYSYLEQRNVTHGSEGHVHMEELTDKGRKLLCCAMKDEIAICGNLIQRATNLNAAEKTVSLLAAAQQCGAEDLSSFNASCSDA